MAEASPLLPSNQTPFLAAEDLTDAAALAALDPAIIRRSKDPLLCAPGIVPLLAWERSVDLWYDDWSEAKKRDVVDRWYDHERLKGTPAGIRAFQRLVDAKVTALVLPPVGLYGIAEYSEAERAQYLARLDQVRVHRYYPVDLDADGFFAGESFLGEDFYDSEPAFFGYRKRAFLHSGGIVTDLTVDWQETVDVEGRSVHLERVILPGRLDAGLYADCDHYGADFFDADGLGERIIEIANPATYRSDYGRLQFGYVVPRNRRVAVEPQTVTEIGPPDPAGTFAEADFYADGSFLMPDTGWTQVYDRYYLHTPDASIELIETGGCYYGEARYGIAPYTAEVTTRKLGKQLEYGADEFFGVGYYLPPELEDWRRIIDAAALSGSGRDTLYVQTATYRWPLLSDGLPLDGSWPLDEMIEDR